MKKPKKLAPPTESGSELERELEEWALQLARDARNEPDIPTQTSAFRAVQAYYAMTRKLPAPEDPAKEGKAKFNGYAKSLGAAQRGDGGTAPVEIRDHYPGAHDF